jgi:hypothetical protein
MYNLTEDHVVVMNRSVAGILRESVMLNYASSCQTATGAPWQAVEFTD